MAPRSRREAVAGLAVLEAVVELVRLPVRAQLAVPLPLAVEAEPAPDLAEEEASVEALHRWFSAAMAGNLTSTETPRYSPVPRSGRRAKRRP